MTVSTAEIHIVDAGGPHERVNIALMNRMGWWDRVGVRPTKTYVDNGGQAAELLLAGKVDVAMQVGFGPMLAAIDDDAPFKVIAGANLLAVHAVYSKNPDIRSLRDLEGRRVGTGRLGALTHQLIYAALLKAGVDPAKVTFVPMGNSASIFRALLADELDAGFGETDVYNHQDRYGVHALEGAVLWRELPDFPNQASVARQDTIRDKRDALVRTLAAHALLYRYLHNPDSWADYAVAWREALPGQPLEEGKVLWQFYQDYKPYAADLLLPEAKLGFIQQLNVTMGLQSRIWPFADITDMSMVRDALKLIED
jgi:ABC-type nitrate/sulfonate/bicarbonate transport system substrate-binding protein